MIALSFKMTILGQKTNTLDRLPVENKQLVVSTKSILTSIFYPSHPLLDCPIHCIDMCVPNIFNLYFG